MLLRIAPDLIASGLIEPILIQPIQRGSLRLPPKCCHDIVRSAWGYTVLLVAYLEKPNFTPRALPGPDREAMRQQNMC